MKTIDEIIFEEFIEIPEYNREWYSDYLVARERIKVFEQKLEPILFEEYLKISNEKNVFDCLRLRDLCKFAIERYKELIK